MGFRLLPKKVTLRLELNNLKSVLMTIILRYFAEFGSFRGPLRKSD